MRPTRPSPAEVRRALRDAALLWRPPDKETPIPGAEIGVEGVQQEADPNSTPVRTATQVRQVQR